MRVSGVAGVCLALLCGVHVVAADVIVLVDGRRIEAESVQERKGTVWYQVKAGSSKGYLGIEKASVREIIKEEKASPEKSIIVYGRMTCGWTVKYLDDIKSRGIKDVIFKNVDDSKVQMDLYLKMTKAGMDTMSYLLPVIEVNSVLMVRPELEKVILLYQKARASDEKKPDAVMNTPAIPLPSPGRMGP